MSWNCAPARRRRSEWSPSVRGRSELRAAVHEAEIMETAFSDAPGGVALIGMDGRFLRVNESLCEILGRSEEEIVGSTSAGFTHPDDLVVTAEAFDALRAGAPGCAPRSDICAPTGRSCGRRPPARRSKGPTGSSPTSCLTSGMSPSNGWPRSGCAPARRTCAPSRRSRVSSRATRIRARRSAPPRRRSPAPTSSSSGSPTETSTSQVTAATGIELSPDLRLPLTGEITATAIAYHRARAGVFLDMHAPGRAGVGRVARPAGGGLGAV